MKLSFEEAFVPTKAQLELIEWMEDFSCPKFTGTTMMDASAYIRQNYEFYQLMQMDSWGLNYE